MPRNILKLLAGLSFAATVCSAQTLSSKWEDLTSTDFVKAIQKADGVCLLPMGSVEKFGPSAPLGTNLYLGRVIPLEAVKQSYAVIFPEYFVAGTTDTSTLPGTIHYSMNMQLQFLEETTHEMARNGCRKIILANGHTGGPFLSIIPFMGTSFDGFAARLCPLLHLLVRVPHHRPSAIPVAARRAAFEAGSRRPRRRRARRRHAGLLPRSDSSRSRPR